MEVYMETVRDLLGAPSGGAAPVMRVHESPARGVFVDGLTDEVRPFNPRACLHHADWVATSLSLHRKRFWIWCVLATVCVPLRRRR
jgi:hypothetical protein